MGELYVAGGYLSYGSDINGEWWTVSTSKHIFVII